MIFCLSWSSCSVAPTGGSIWSSIPKWSRHPTESIMLIQQLEGDHAESGLGLNFMAHSSQPLLPASLLSETGNLVGHCGGKDVLSTYSRNACNVIWSWCFIVQSGSKTKFGSQNFGYQLWCLFCNISNVLKNMFNVGLIIMWWKYCDRGIPHNWDTSFLFHILMAWTSWCGAAVTPLLTHWSCCSLAISHQYQTDLFRNSSFIVYCVK